jgi:hypothetical protein
MARSGPEVADIFRRYGAAYRESHGASLCIAQRRVMSAIELCRTAALGGHVERCDHCDHQRICYNSCLMGKFRNGELAAVSSAAKPESTSFCSPLRFCFEQSDEPVRRSEGSFAQVWWNETPICTR